MSKPQRCMAGLPPTKELIGLKIPYGAWEPDTLITDTFGNPIFSVLDVQHNAMGAYEAIFGDENGHKLCYVKRRLITKYWKDGWDFCTYRPNFPGQPKYKERDMYGKSVYPFSCLMVRPLKCSYAYSVHEEDMESMDTFLEAMHGWLGSMTVCCTPMVRLGKWQIDFHRPGAGDPEINIDQSKNLLEVERGNDLLAALCIAYAFDKALCQPLVTIIGYQEKEHMDDDDDSLEDFEERAMPPMPQEEYPALPAPDDYHEDPDEVSGYLGYGEEEQPEVSGYLEAQPYRDDPEQPEVDGYLESSSYNDRGQPKPDGYLESTPYSDNPEPDGYLESGAYDDNGDGYDGYIDNGDDGYYGESDHDGYIDNGGYGAETDVDQTRGQQRNNNDGRYIAQEGFKDEDDDLD